VRVGEAVKAREREKWQQVTLVDINHSKLTFDVSKICVCGSNPLQSILGLTFVATIKVGALLREPPGNGRTNNRIVILMSSGV
jgi:hypothetical protein